MNAVGFLLLIQVCFGQRFDLDGGDGLVGQRLVVNRSVSHIEQDLINEVELIYSDVSMLKFTADNLTYGADYVGYAEGSPEEARFRFLEGFLQLNKSIIILVDRKNGCLRQLDRISSLTKRFSGNCAFRVGTYDDPHSIIRDKLDENRLIFTADQSLGYIDLTSPESPVSFIKNYLYLNKASGIVQHANTGYLYITASTYTGLTKMNYPESIFTYLSTEATKFPTELIFIAPQLLLITNHQSSTLTVFDVESNRTTKSICSGRGGNVDGNFSVCQINDPSSVVIIGNSLLIGAKGQIREIRGRWVTAVEDADKKKSTLVTVLICVGVASILFVTIVLSFKSGLWKKMI